MCADVVDNDGNVDDSVRFSVLLYGGAALGVGRYLHVRKFICYMAAAHFHFSRMRRQYIAAIYISFGILLPIHARLYANISKFIFKHIQSLFIKTHDILSS